MDGENSKAAASLRKLGERLRQSWDRAHPISQETLEKVRQAVRESWEAKQGISPDTEKQSGPEQQQQQSTDHQPEKRASQDPSHGHDMSQ